MILLESDGSTSEIRTIDYQHPEPLAMTPALTPEERAGYTIVARLQRKVSYHETKRVLILANGLVRRQTVYTWKGGTKTETPWTDWTTTPRPADEVISAFLKEGFRSTR